MELPTRQDRSREGRESKTLADLTAIERDEDGNPKENERELSLTERLYVDHASGRVSDSDALRRLLALVAGCHDDAYADEQENR